MKASQNIEPSQKEKVWDKKRKLRPSYFREFTTIGSIYGSPPLHRPLFPITSSGWSRAVDEYLATAPVVMVEWLPPYAPELNREEYCHGNVKHQLRNTTSASVEQMQEQVDRGLSRFWKRLDLLLWFFRYAGLGVKCLT